MIVMSRATDSIVERLARDLLVERRKVFAHPVEFADMPFDRDPLVVGHRLPLNQPRPTSLNRSACGHGGIRCACRMACTSFLIRVRCRTI